MPEKIITTEALDISLSDLTYDFLEISALGQERASLIENNILALKEKKGHLERESLSYNLSLLENTLKDSREIITSAENAIQEVSKSPSLNTIKTMQRVKNNLHLKLRIVFASSSSSISALDWQSPAYGVDTKDNAGRQTGLIMATVNDYKRDQHEDAKNLEKLFLKSCPLSSRPFIKAYSTSCGMSAFAVILFFLQTEKQVSKVLAGKNIYHEAKINLSKAFGNNLTYINERDTDKFIKEIKNPLNKALFLDTITNSEEIANPDIEKIIREGILKRKGGNFCFILDNALAGPFFSVFSLIPASKALTANLTVISYESLNKFYQFGLDRVTGGIILAAGRDVGKMYDIRDHLGANIPDYNSLAVPKINRSFLIKRLRRIERNAILIKEGIEKSLEEKKGRISHVSYPPPNILKTPSGPVLNFRGPLLTVVFRKKSIPLYKTFIRKAVKYAQKYTAPLLEGTSFGLNTSRIYLTSLRNDRSNPFVRISPGTENYLETQNLIRVFQKAVRETG